MDRDEGDGAFGTRAGGTARVSRSRDDPFPVRQRPAVPGEDPSIPFIPVDCLSFTPDAGPVVHFRIQGTPSLAKAFPSIL